MSAKKAVKAQAAPEVQGPPPAPVVSPFRAETIVTVSSRLRLTFAEPTVEQMAEAVKHYKSMEQRDETTLADLAREKSAVWALLLSAETRVNASAKTPWLPAEGGWREQLWSEGGLSADETVHSVWGRLFRGAIRSAFEGPPRPRRPRA